MALVAGRMRGAFGARAPYVDAGKQEQPHHVDEMPVPGRELEAEMLRGREMAEIDTDQADNEECRPDDDMGAVKPGRHEECRAIDMAGVVERGMTVFVALHHREGEPEQNGEDQA